MPHFIRHLTDTFSIRQLMQILKRANASVNPNYFAIFAGREANRSSSSPELSSQCFARLRRKVSAHDISM
jgi:hypothetical protein